MEAIDSKISDIEYQIIQVNDSIDSAVQEIVKEDQKENPDLSRLQSFREREKQLREEKNKLLDGINKLREEKNQLREIEVLKLKQANAQQEEGDSSYNLVIFTSYLIIFFSYLQKKKILVRHVILVFLYAFCTISLTFCLTETTFSTLASIFAGICAILALFDNPNIRITACCFGSCAVIFCCPWRKLYAARKRVWNYCRGVKISASA
jgi:hypothetical protein